MLIELNMALLVGLQTLNRTAALAVAAVVHPECVASMPSGTLTHGMLFFSPAVIVLDQVESNNIRFDILSYYIYCT